MRHSARLELLRHCPKSASRRPARALTKIEGRGETSELSAGGDQEGRGSSDDRLGSERATDRNSLISHHRKPRSRSSKRSWDSLRPSRGIANRADQTSVRGKSLCPNLRSLSKTPPLFSAGLVVGSRSHFRIQGVLLTSCEIAGPTCGSDLLRL